MSNLCSSNIETLGKDDWIKANQNYVRYMKDDELKKKLLEALQSNPIIAHACKKIGVGRSTFYRWLKEDSVFNKAKKYSQKIGLSIICDAAESKVLYLMNNGKDETSLKAAKLILYTYHPYYKKMSEGSNYQKQMMKDEINKLKSELDNSIDDHIKALNVMFEISKNNKTGMGDISEIEQQLNNIQKRLGFISKNETPQIDIKS